MPPAPEAPVVTVVAAIVERDGRFLVTSRPAGVHLAGLWEFPGGKVGAGETHAAALGREMREELDVDVDVHELVLSTTHAYPGKTVALHFYRCSLKGTPRPMLDQRIEWAAPESLDRMEFPPADAELLRVLQAGRH